jgi:hypothetical protein
MPVSRTAAVRGLKRAGLGTALAAAIGLAGGGVEAAERPLMIGVLSGRMSL